MHETTLREAQDRLAAATCPVCGWDVTESGQEVRVGDSTLRVCCDDCARAVALSPTKYRPR